MVGQGEQSAQIELKRSPRQFNFLRPRGQCLYQAFHILLARDGLASAPFGDRITAPLTKGLADDFLEVFERRTARVFDLPKKVGQQITEAFPVSRHGASCRAKFPGKISNIPRGEMCYAV